MPVIQSTEKLIRILLYVYALKLIIWKDIIRKALKRNMTAEGMTFFLWS